MKLNQKQCQKNVVRKNVVKSSKRKEKLIVKVALKFVVLALYNFTKSHQMKYLFVIIGLTFMSYTWPIKLEQKIRMTIEKTFKIVDYNIIEVDLIEDPNLVDKFPLKGNFYQVKSNEKNLGYFYTHQAASMKNVFDYILVFDNNKTIINSKVLIYREKHGRQIGTKRWLSQFTGLSFNDRPKLGEGIDGISGATISATNMTNAVSNVLKALSQSDFK